MDAEPEDAGANQGEVDTTFDVFANVAAAAAPLPTNKRPPPLQSGRNQCFVVGCDCTTGLVGIAPKHCADAEHIMRTELRIDLGEWKGQPRSLPRDASKNRVCAKHMPNYSEQPIIGAKVLLHLGDRFVKASITGPALIPGGLAGRGARAARGLGQSTTKWHAQAEAGGADALDMSTDEGYKSEALRAAYDVDVAKVGAKKINALRHQVRYAKQKLEPQPPPPAAARGAPSPRPSPRPAAAPPMPPATTATITITVPLSRSWVAGDMIQLDVPAGHVPRSRAVRIGMQPPAGSIAGSMCTFTVDLPLDPPTAPPATVSKSGRKAADARRYITARAAAYGLSYSPSPNPLNPPRSWPLREQLTFANLRPEYFQLPERTHLFKKLFGFDDWESAMVVFERVYAWDEQARTRRKREEAAILHPRFQYLAALWRMRCRKGRDELASFFGVRDEAMSEYIPRWIRRLGRYAKENLVFEPKDYQVIIDMMPQAFIDCGLGSVVAIGDCTDIMTEDSRENKYVSNQSRSDKSKHAAAMGLIWVTPNGAIIIATDLFLGRSSEHEACKACLPALNRIPAQYSLMYDKGVSKLRVHLTNLNQVITPCYLRQAARFTVEQGIRNRGVTCCRYIVECPFSNMKAWDFLGGVVREEEKYLLNDVWWWTIGFHNLKHQILKPRAGI